MNGNRFRLLVLAAVMLLIVSACGGEDTSSSTAAASPSAGQDSDPAQESDGEPSSGSDASGGEGLSSGGGTGTYTVDGEAVESPVYRCDVAPSSGQEPHPDDLAVLAFQGGSDGLEVEVGHSTRPSSSGAYEATILFVFYSRSGADGLEQFEGSAATGPDGQWYLQSDFDFANPFAEPPITVNGNRITGSLANVEQDYPEDGTATVDVTFDLEIPNEITEGC